MYFWLVTILFEEGSLCCCCSKWFRPPCSAAGSPLAVVGVKWIFMCPPGCPPWWHHLNPIKFAIGRAFAPSVTTRSRPRLERHTRRRGRRTRSPPPTSISDDLQLTTIAIFYTDIRLDSGNSLYYNISTITSYCIYSFDIHLR